ncbi:glycosyltransferase family 39 protein [bacterium]|nr:glycosyltransferase family 39 protein [candidate division CSSED10-310 bacterium]
MFDTLPVHPAPEVMARQIDLLTWIAGLALILAFGAWIPWIWRYLAGSDFKPEYGWWRWFVNMPYGILTLCFRGILLVLRKFRVLLLLGLTGSLLVVFLSGPKTPGRAVPAMIISLVCFMGLLYRSGRKMHLLTGGFLIWLVVLNHFTVTVYPEWLGWTGKLMNVESGLELFRYGNMEWREPLVETLRIAQVDFKSPESIVLNGSNFSFQIRGWLYTDRNGLYRFTIRSDDGAFLEIDGEPLLSNPGFHAASEVSGELSLDPGYHLIDIRYFNGTADAELKLFWQPPDQPEHIIPACCFFTQIPSPARRVLFHVLHGFFTTWLNVILGIGGVLLIGLGFETVRKYLGRDVRRDRILRLWNMLLAGLLKNGPSLCFGMVVGLSMLLLFAVWYHGIDCAAVDHGLKLQFYGDDVFSRKTDQADGRNARFNSITSRLFDRHIFGAVFHGYLNILQSGSYGFAIQADNGARFYIDEEKMIDGWNADPRTRLISTVKLDTGLHPVRIEMHNRFVPAFIDWKYQPPGKRGFSPVPLSILYSDYPKAAELRADLQFQKVRFSVMILLAAVVLLGMAGIGFFSFPSVFTNVAVPFSLAVFISGFLLQARYLHRDHQYGVQWFIYLAAGWKMLLIAALIALSFPCLRRLLANIPSILQRSGTARAVLFAGILLTAVWGQMCFTGIQRPEPWKGALLFGIAALLTMLNHRLLPGWTDQNDGSEPSRPDPVFWAAVAVILYFAAFLRFYRLHELPPGLWWDETQTAIISRDILKGWFPPVYDLRINAGTPASYVIAGWFYLFGTSVHALRAYYAAVGVITVAVSYGFFRLFFSRWWSLFGMALIATSRWLFSINRVAMATIDETVLLTFLVFICYIRASRSGKLRYYISTGMLLGLGLYLHTGARVLPVIIGLDLIIRLVLERKEFFKRHAAGSAMMIGVSVIVFIPLAKHIYQHQDDYFRRSRQTLLSTEYPGWYPVPPLAENVVNYMKMYSYSGDWHPRHNQNREPQLPPPVSVLSLIGLSCLAVRILRKDARLFIMGFVLVSLQGILTIHNNTANLNRVAENIPIVHLWAVIGLLYLSAGIKRIWNPRAAKILTVAAAVFVIGISSARAYRIYFREYSENLDLIGVFGFQPELTEPAEYIRKLLRERNDLEIWAEYINADSFRYIQPRHPRLHDLTRSAAVRFSPGFSTAILILSQNDSLTRTIRERYPDAEEVEVPYSLDRNHVLFRVFYLPAGFAD